MAAAEVAGLVAGESAPEPAVVRQFQDETAALQRSVCQEMKSRRGLAEEGAVDIRTLAEQIIVDATVSALLTMALAAPLDERDRLLSGLNVEAIGPDRVTKITGMAALQDAGIVDAEGHFAMPPMESGEDGKESADYDRYLGWYNREAEGSPASLVC